jgi:hypothetical protein
MAMDVVHLLTRAVTPVTEGHALLVDIVTGEQRLEPIPRDPECPACGERLR